MTRKGRSLNSTIRFLGLVQTFALGLLIPVSWGMTVIYSNGFHCPDPGGYPCKELDMFRCWLDAAGFLPGSVKAPLISFLGGESPLERRWVAALAYHLPCLAASVVFLCLLTTLYRKRENPGPETTARLTRWSVVYATVTLVMVPIFTQDLWYSVAWGRMAAHGDNPYYSHLTTESLEDQPLAFSRLRMTYGPLWCMTSTGVAWISQGNTFTEYLLHKSILYISWLITLSCIIQITGKFSERNRALAVAVFGWMPLSTLLSIGEAHNDIVMVCLLMIWITLLLRSRHRLTPFFLVASVLVKYVTLPLFPVELAAAWKKGWMGRWRYWISLAVSSGMAAAIISLYARDRHFLEPILSMQKWPPVFSPSAALMHAFAMAGRPIPYQLAWWIVFIPCLGILVHASARFLKNGTAMPLINLIIAVLALILLAAIGHIWPWFLIWILAPCALNPDNRLSLFMIILCLLGPFLAFSVFWDQYAAGLILYIGAFSLLLIILHLRPPDRTTEQAARFPTHPANI